MRFCIRYRAFSVRFSKNRIVSKKGIFVTNCKFSLYFALKARTRLRTYYCLSEGAFVDCRCLKMRRGFKNGRFSRKKLVFREGEKLPCSRKNISLSKERNFLEQGILGMQGGSSQSAVIKSLTLRMFDNCKLLSKYFFTGMEWMKKGRFAYNLLL